MLKVTVAFLIVFGSVMNSACFSQVDSGKDPENSPVVNSGDSGKNDEVKLGLVAALVEVKHISETTLLQSYKDLEKAESELVAKRKSKAKYDDSDDIKIIEGLKIRCTDAEKSYNRVRVGIDKVLTQLVVEMKMDNSSKLFKKLNKYYLENSFYATTTNTDKKTKRFTQSFARVASDFQNLAGMNDDETRKGVSVTDAIDAAISIVELGWTITKDVSDMKARKVEGVVGVLSDLRLVSSFELKKSFDGEDSEDCSNSDDAGDCSNSKEKGNDVGPIKNLNPPK